MLQGLKIFGGWGASCNVGAKNGDRSKGGAKIQGGVRNTASRIQHPCNVLSKTLWGRIPVSLYVPVGLIHTNPVTLL